MIKWNPVYRVSIYTQNETVRIMLPLTCKMTITRSTLAENVSADIEIYGLSQTTRNIIHQPPFNTWGERAKFVTVEAGYGDINSMYLIFKGAILQAYSMKQGGTPEIITKIQAQALDLFTSQSSVQFPAGTEKREILNTLCADLKDCTIGNIGAISGTIKTATTFDGDTFDCLNKLTDGNTFIDNGVINTILGNECIDVPVPTIDDTSVLLATPLRNAENLTIKTLFMPDLIVGQLVNLHTNIESENYDGYYKVLGFTHDLFFSGSLDGQRTTSIELWSGKLLQNTPLAVSGDEVQNTFNKVKGTEVTPVESNTNTNWIMPVTGRISSYYGKRTAPTAGASDNHSGIDIAVPIGTPVKAIADGVVYAINLNSTGYGKAVFINHGKVNGKVITSEYGHISRAATTVSQKVKQGQIIAYSGNTGVSTGPHLHLTIRENGKHVDPLKYVKN